MLAQGSQSLADALAGESQIHIELSVAEGIHAQADWPLFRQAVLNLLPNAVR